MNKDRILKIKLLRYFLQRFWYPQLEVDILSKQRVSLSKKLITDIDVLGLYPDVTGNLNLILGDCKTLKGQSPITRSLWIRGLMDYLNADKGIIILSKNIEKEHQLTSSFLNIQLLSENDFENYSKRTANYLNSFESALSYVENWDLFFNIEKKFPTLNILSNFSKAEFWNESQSNNRLRNALFILKNNRGELNPSNNLHLTILLNHFSLFAIALNDIITKIFSRYLIPTSEKEFDADLKAIIWGTIDNYQYLNDLRKKFINSSIQESDLTLPDWKAFIELIRLFLENPMAVNSLPLYLKEIAFSFLTPGIKYNYAKAIASNNRFITTFAIRLSDYLVKASRIPSEFNEILTEKFTEIES